MHVASPVASHSCTATIVWTVIILKIMATSKTKNEFVPGIGAPATRALQNAGIDSLKKLSTYTEKEILKLHGVGKTAIPKLKKALSEEGFDFKK